MANPFFTYAGIMERATNLVHLYLHNDPMVVGYQVWTEVLINDAYGNPAGSGVGGLGSTALFQAARGETYRSPLIRRRGRGLLEENRRGTTHMVFDFEEWTVGGAGQVIPLDEEFVCIRVQENRFGAGLLNLGGVPANPVLGPIYLIPPMSAYGTSGPTFTTQATAPSATGCVAGAVPLFDEDLTSAAPRPMYLVFPSPLTEFTLTNQDGVKDLLVSFGPGQPMMTVPAGGETQLYSGRTKEMVLACPAAGGCPFSLHGVMSRS